MGREPTEAAYLRDQIYVYASENIWTITAEVHKKSPWRKKLFINENVIRQQTSL